MKEKWQHIFNPGPCPSVEELMDYHYGKLNLEQSAAIENHLAGCEICTDILEGIENSGEEKILHAETELQTRINKLLFKEEKKKTLFISYRKLAIAASILLLVSISSILYYINQQNNNKTELASTLKNKPSFVKKDTTIIALNKKTQQFDYKTIVSKNKKTTITEPTASNQEIIPDITIENKEPASTSEIKVDEESFTPVTSETRAPVMADKEKSEFKVTTNAKRATAYFGKKTISGKVLDETGAGLPGATVMVKGTQQGVVTDIDGNFTIEVPENASILAVSYVGYASKEEDITDKNDVNIAMAADVKTLNEVVVVGYGTMKKADLTGAIAKVDAKSLNKASSTKFDQALQGKTSGVMVARNNAEIDSLLKIDNTNGLNINIYKQLAERYLELNNTEKTIEQLNIYKAHLTDSDKIKEVENIITLIQNNKLNKALRKLKNLK